MTAAEIRARLAELREAGLKLRRRPARDTLEVLARVLDAWSDPASPWRRGLEAELPAASGFTAPVVHEGLRRGLESWSGSALRGLVEAELGGTERLDSPGADMVTGFDTTAVLLAGSIPMPSLASLVAPLVLRSPVLAKTATGDRVTARWVARSLAEVDADVGRCVEVVEVAGHEADAIEAILEADCVVANGSDQTIAAVTRRAGAARRLVTYGHRASLAALGDAATQGQELDAAARGLALDVAVWDQLGCLSPLAVYAVSPDAEAVDRVAQAVAGALDELGQRLPRGQVDAAARALTAHQRADAELRRAAGRRVELYTGSTWTVVREDDAAHRPAPLHRFVRVHPVRDESALLAALEPMGPWLAGVAVAGFGAGADRVALALARLGASRVCVPGSLQAPPLGWRRDGRGVVTTLARFTDWEAPAA